ncbi:MAG TPA: hypothetical protein VKA27_04860 [Sunxiuqinia sp.]|nr:hypothetical protein [Sunxiuqinia sp.]
MKNATNWIVLILGGLLTIGMVVNQYTLGRADSNQKEIGLLKDEMKNEYLLKSDYKDDLTGIRLEIKDLNKKLDSIKVIYRESP